MLALLSSTSALLPASGFAATGREHLAAAARLGAVGLGDATLALGSGYDTPRGSSAVRMLQRRLMLAGDSPGPIDGRYGPLTRGAVMRFQASHGLAGDGIVGPQTWALTRSLALSTGLGGQGPSDLVRTLQRRLASAGFATGPIDGRFGVITERAVRQFQVAHALPANGIVAGGTRALLAAPALVLDRGSRHVLRAPVRATYTTPAAHQSPALPRTPAAHSTPTASNHRDSTPSTGLFLAVIGLLLALTVIALILASGAARYAIAPAKRRVSAVGVGAGRLRLSVARWLHARPRLLRRLRLHRLSWRRSRLGISRRRPAPSNPAESAVDSKRSASAPSPQRRAVKSRRQPPPAPTTQATKRVRPSRPAAAKRGRKASPTPVPAGRPSADTGLRNNGRAASSNGHHAANGNGKTRDLDAAAAIAGVAKKRHDPANDVRLGERLEEQGDLAGAEAAYRRADGTGDAEAAFRLAMLLGPRSSQEAEAAYRRADQRGHGAAASNLGVMLEQRGAKAEAEAAYRRGDQRDDAGAAFNLGVLLAEQGNPAGAAAALYRAAQRGDHAAASNLGVLLEQQGDVEGALEAYRHADEHGDANGSFNLGLLLAGQGNPIGAREAYERAAERGDPDVEERARAALAELAARLPAAAA